MTNRKRFPTARLAVVATLVAAFCGMLTSQEVLAHPAAGSTANLAPNYLLVPQQTNIATAECLVFAVFDGELADSQFLRISMRGNTVTAFGPEYKQFDIEGIEIDPATNILYAVSGADNNQGKQGYLFKVDAQTAELFEVGPSGFKELPALSVRPGDNTFWSWSEGDGLIELDKTTGAGTLSISSKLNVEGLAWNLDGSILYGVAGSDLYTITPGGAVTRIARNLPGSGQAESLEIRPDGLLMGGFHKSANLEIFAYNPVTLQPVRSQGIQTEYNDIESLAYPQNCPAPDDEPTPTPTSTPSPTALLTATPTLTATPDVTTTATPTGTTVATPIGTTVATPTSTTVATTSPTMTPTPTATQLAPPPGDEPTPTPEEPTPVQTVPPPPTDEPTPVPTPTTPGEEPTPTSTPTEPPAPTSTPTEPTVSTSTPTEPPVSTSTPTEPTVPPAQLAPPAEGAAQLPEPFVLGVTEEDEPTGTRPRAVISNLGAATSAYTWWFAAGVLWIMLGVALHIHNFRRR